MERVSSSNKWRGMGKENSRVPLLCLVPDEEVGCQSGGSFLPQFITARSILA
jgi:hypothetical protein